MLQKVLNVGIYLWGMLMCTSNFTLIYLHVFFLSLKEIKAKENHSIEREIKILHASTKFKYRTRDSTIRLSLSLRK